VFSEKNQKLSKKIKKKSKNPKNGALFNDNLMLRFVLLYKKHPKSGGEN